MEVRLDPVVKSASHRLTGGISEAFRRGYSARRAAARSMAGHPRNKSSALDFRALQQGDTLEPLLDLVETGHKESRFGDIPFSRGKARRIGERALAEGNRNLLIVAELRGRPVAFLLASVGEFHIGTGALLTTIHAAYTEPSLRRSLLGGRAGVTLLRAAERWSRGIGAREIMLHVTGGIAGSHPGRIAMHLGFEATGGAFAKGL